MKKRTIYITLFLIFIIGVISLIGTFAIDSSITEGNSTKADYLFNITLGDRTNREIVIPSYDSKIVDIKISNPNEFNMSYLLYLEGVNSNLSIINISDNESSGVLNSKTNTLIKVFIQNNSSSDITTSIKDIVGFENEKLSLPSNNTSINKGTYYKVIVKSNDNTYGKVKPNIKLSTSKGTVKYTISPNTGYQYKSTTCNGTVSNNILTISNITSNVNCEVVFEPIQVTVNFDMAGGEIGEQVYDEAKEYTYTVLATGIYKLEAWGAQGGVKIAAGTSTTGYGGYSVGNIKLSKGDVLYINVGGAGLTTSSSNKVLQGGYNGGGKGYSYSDSRGGASGGGATHIATVSGLLSTLSSSIDKILIVSGGGGGSDQCCAGYSKVAGSGGGYIGATGTYGNSIGYGGTQSSGGYGTDNSKPSGYEGSFGQGGNCTKYDCAGGGGGYYGGAAIIGGGGYGSGGSGYIGNLQLTDKYMYCYDCPTSDETDTKTYTTTNVSSTPTSNYAKSGSGAAKISFINATKKIIYGGEYSGLPEPTKVGFVLDGWYTEPDGKGKKITENTILTNSNEHTLYAYWKQPTEYNVHGSYTYTIPRTGLYKLETWGAQGGQYSTTKIGYGGYSTGMVLLKKGDILFLNVGGQGVSANAKSTFTTGGYNGGGNANYSAGTGGGATHIATKSGLLSSLSSDLSSILIVAGGGGGTGVYNANEIGGSGGGIQGNTGGHNSGSFQGGGGGGTQTAGGSLGSGSVAGTVGQFGVGGQGGYEARYEHGSGGGGGGLYGGAGGSARNGGGGGGSGYIGNSLLTDKYMYCYNCATSDATDTKTYTTTNVSETPISDYAKGGDGAIKITFIGADDEPPTGTMSTSIDHNTINVSINATDNYGIDHYEYYLSTSSTCPTTGYTASASNTYSFAVKQTGTYYVCAKVVDGNDNVLSLKSNAIDISRVYYVKIRYNTNGGTITPNTGNYTWTTDSTGLIYRDGTVYEQVVFYGENVDLADYNNSNFINIDPGDLHVPFGGEWICLSGCSTADKVYNQATKYSTNDFCDVTNANCTVTMGLRLVSDTTPPTCTLSASGSNITAAASDDSGIAYQGWDSSYSGDNSTSKDIASGTHTYYVKDTAGNTNTCSISISGLVEKDIPYTETSAAYANYTTVYSGSCRCSKKATGGTSYVEGYCNPSSGCSCPGGTSISSNSCIGTKKVTGYYCPGNGTVSGSTCIYTKYKITYVCPDGYSGVSGNSNYCYKY